MWNKVTIAKYQQIDEISNRKISDEDKMLFSVCVLFDKTEYQLDNIGKRKGMKLINKATKIFSSELIQKVVKWIGPYQINYDLSKLSFGQYIELSFFLSNGPVQNAHYVFATLSHLPLLRNNANKHRSKAEWFLKQPMTKIIGGIAEIIKLFTAFNAEYKSLFGLDREVSGDVQEDKFNKRYGWIYAASQIAEYERIALDQAFNLPVRQAFNDLAYLKAKAKYEAEQLKSN